MIDLKKLVDGKSQESALTTREEALPVYIKKGDRRGTEHIRKDDLQMPRLTLAQGLSPQMQKGNPRFISGLEVGNMFNNLTEEIYGDGPLEFTIVRADPPRGIEFYPLDEGGGIKDFNVPVDDPRMQFGPQGEKPTATKFYDFVVVMFPTMEVIALSLKGTSLKTARELNALMKLRNVPSFGGKYTLKSAMQTNKSGTFAVFSVKQAGFVNEEQYKFCEDLYEAIKDKPLDIEREPEDDIVVEATPF